MVARELYTTSERILSFPKICVNAFFTFRRRGNLAEKAELVGFEISHR
jgi:hypothetical protein